MEPSFWTEQYYDLPKPVLYYFLFVHVVLSIFIIFIYLQLKYKLIENLKQNFGIIYFDEYTIHINKTIKFSSLGFLLILINNIITHMSGLIYPDRGYLLVGSDAIIGFIGLALVFIGINNLLIALVKTPRKKLEYIEKYSTILIYTIFIAFVFLSIFSILGVEIGIVGDFFRLFIVSFFILATAIIIYILKLNQYSNKIVKVRFYLFTILYTLTVILLAFAISFTPSPGQDPTQFWTRQPKLEFLNFSIDLWVILASLLIYSILVLPKIILQLFGVTKDDYEDFLEKGIETNWKELHWEQFKKRNYSQEYANQHLKSDNLDYHVLHNLTDDMESSQHNQVIQALSSVVNINQVVSLDTYYEEYFSNYVLNKSNLIFVSTKEHPTIDDITDGINSNYGINIQYDPYLEIDSFNYKLKSLEIALIVIIPSLWNLKNKFWLILGRDEVIPKLSEFILKFGKYLDDRSDVKVTFALLKFPKEGDKILSILSSKISPDIPKSDSIAFL